MPLAAKASFAASGNYVTPALPATTTNDTRK
jgi:hypothetical protein